MSTLTDDVLILKTMGIPVWYQSQLSSSFLMDTLNVPSDIVVLSLCEPEVPKFEQMIQGMISVLDISLERISLAYINATLDNTDVEFFNDLHPRCFLILGEESPLVSSLSQKIQKDCFITFSPSYLSAKPTDKKIAYKVLQSCKNFLKDSE